MQDEHNSLMSLSNIQARLDTEFAPIQEMKRGLVLEAARHGIRERIVQTEQRLRFKFPEEFSEMLNRYRLDGFQLGPNSFLGGSDYLDSLVRINNVEELNESKQRESSGSQIERLVVASSDAFVTFLSRSGRVLVMKHGEAPSTIRQAASDFIAYFRGLGTVFFARIDGKESSSKIASDVASVVGGQDAIEYWKYLSA